MTFTTASIDSSINNITTMARKSLSETRTTIDLIGDDSTSLSDAVAIGSALWRKQLLRFAILIVNLLVAAIAGSIWLHERIRRHTWTRRFRSFIAAKALLLLSWLRQQAPIWRHQALTSLKRTQQRLQQALIDAGLTTTHS